MCRSIYIYIDVWYIQPWLRCSWVSFSRGPLLFLLTWAAMQQISKRMAAARVDPATVPIPHTIGASSTPDNDEETRLCSKPYTGVQELLQDLKVRFRVCRCLLAAFYCLSTRVAEKGLQMFSCGGFLLSDYVGCVLGVADVCLGGFRTVRVRGLFKEEGMFGSWMYLEAQQTF